MASKPKAPNIEPDKQYRVFLTKPVMLGRTMLHPKADNVIKGKALATIVDKVDRYDPVEQ